MFDDRRYKSLMDYNHSRKAGNLGDVWKHFILVELANVITQKSDVFRYAESHCGAPIHELTDRGEWRRGIGKLSKDTSCDFEYLSVAREWLKTKQYPAGWVFMARQLAERFTEVEVNLFDTNDEVAATYPPGVDARIPRSALIEFRQEDGYTAVQKLAGADLMFLDPPFYPNAKADWRLLTSVCAILESRHTDFVVWYPFYWPTKPQEFSNRTQASAWEVHWAPCGPKPSQNLKGCGMLVSNNIMSKMQALKTKLTRMAGYMQSELVIRRPVEHFT